MRRDYGPLYPVPAVLRPSACEPDLPTALVHAIIRQFAPPGFAAEDGGASKVEPDSALSDVANSFGVR